MKTSKLRTILFYIFMILFIVIVGTRLYQNWAINLGWVQLNKGLSDGNVELTSLDQSSLIENLSMRQVEHYLALQEANLSSGELLLNGGFEFFFQGWVVQGANNILPQITSEEAYSGYNSMQIFFSDQDVNFYQTFQEVGVMPSTCYLLQAQLKMEDLTDNIALEIWDAVHGYEYWYGGQTANVKGTMDWRLVDLRFCTADDVQHIQIRIRRYGGMGQPVSGTVWIDDVSLKAIAETE